MQQAAILLLRLRRQEGRWCDAIVLTQPCGAAVYGHAGGMPKMDPDSRSAAALLLLSAVTQWLFEMLVLKRWHCH